MRTSCRLSVFGLHSAWAARPAVRHRPNVLDVWPLISLGHSPWTQRGNTVCGTSVTSSIGISGHGVDRRHRLALEVCPSACDRLPVHGRRRRRNVGGSRRPLAGLSRYPSFFPVFSSSYPLGLPLRRTRTNGRQKKLLMVIPSA